MDRTKLTLSQIEPLLTELPGWSLHNHRLTKTFTFPAYLDGIAFVQAVGQIAEQLDHHPDIHVGYRTVALSVNTHDVDGITMFDFELARRIQLI